MSKKKLNEDIIRVGDKVIITNPEFFLRCGYNNNYKSACKIIEDTYKQEINKFIYTWEQSTQKTSGKIPLAKLLCEDSPTYLKIVSALAYDLVRKKMKNGKKRKIFTERVNFYQNKTFQVSSIMYVQTGIYCEPRARYDFQSDEYDYTSGFLEKIVCHKILILDSFLYGLSSDQAAIEDCNVKKIFDKQQ